MVNNEQFVKFIIKNIVSDVEYDVSGDKFTINRLVISDDLIEKIISEGLKYNLNADDARELITLVSSDIQVAPSIQRSYANINTSGIQIGCHLKLNFIDSCKGPIYIEALCIEKSRFFVVQSNVPGLKFHDELISINQAWNISYDIDFVLYRKGKAYPDEHSALRIGKLQSIEYFLPSVIHEIFDSQKHFTKEELENTIDAPSNKNVITQCIWTPKRHNPISFALSEQEADPKGEAVFLIKRSSIKATTASISINPQMALPIDSIQKQYLVDTIKECCVVDKYDSAEYFKSELFESIRTLKVGKLRKEKHNEGTELWTLVEKPIIKIVR